MKKSKLKLFPLIIMLVAGSVVSIMTWWFQYEIKAALLILLTSLLVFYVLGLIVIKVISYFDKVNEEAGKALEEAALEQEALEEAALDADAHGDFESQEYMGEEA